MINRETNNIIVGITGGIAAYKSAELVRLLCKQGKTVRVVMTKNAQQFITPLTLQALSGNPVSDELFDREAEAAMGHIELSRWADLILIAPASASFIARLTHGIADDLLTTLCLATKANIVVAPAMNQQMWLNQATQENIAILKKRGIQVIGPATGEQACGEIGPGRMDEPHDIVAQLDFQEHSLRGKTIVITAGPTQEAIDPVRYISNHSSGKMGFALAEAAANVGANVELITGPVNLPTPRRCNRIDVMSANEMHDAVMTVVNKADIFIAAAAVSDYRCESIAKQKIKKQQEPLHLQLIKNPDILADVGQLSLRPLIVGFAAETENMLENAKDKLVNKKCDMMICNDVSRKDIGFHNDDNEVTILTEHEQQIINKMDKQSLAKQLIDMIGNTYAKRTTKNS